MLISCMIFKYTRNNFIDKRETLSARLKNRLLVINVASFLIAGYFFVRHNDYCEPGGKCQKNLAQFPLNTQKLWKFFQIFLYFCLTHYTVSQKLRTTFTELIHWFQYGSIPSVNRLMRGDHRNKFMHTHTSGFCVRTSH